MEQNGTLKKDVFLEIALASGKNASQPTDEAVIGRTTLDRKLANPKFPSPTGSLTITIRQRKTVSRRT